VSNTIHIARLRYIAIPQQSNSNYLKYNEIQYDTYLVRHRCKFFAHTNICKHVLAVNHMMEARKPEGERDQSLNLRLLTRPVSEKNLPAVEGPPAGRVRAASRPCAGQVCWPAVQLRGSASWS